MGIMSRFSQAAFAISLLVCEASTGAVPNTNFRRFTPGIACYYAAPANDGDTCAALAKRYALDELTLISYNQDVLSKDKCILVTGRQYCVESDFVASTSSSRTMIPTSSARITIATSTTQIIVPTHAPESNVSPDGTCAGDGKKTCTGSLYGKCCSKNGWCGDSTDHCGTGCNPLFGTCNSPTNASPDGTCGGTNKYSCTNSTFGKCCSKAGYCGSTASHCGQGCQSSSGTCATSNVASNTGECGVNRGKYTCAGGPFDGMCCSVNGYCGTTVDHCKTGCQKGYGKCS
ncbi:hypothetical protein BCR34DRAFT_576243 [Clohesyomyces aquaticus]|uniref:Chitin-binding type-1 domain-containing protein n=1 Tax=Clohesyomyces aquaticus TaxID=1231657 RepID=A0A1Y1YPI4_9PLEO|nr:hypothetical protein BCR34DRAFT_576243 [Clohesyomyces aquaticus]